MAIAVRRTTLLAVPALAVLCGCGSGSDHRARATRGGSAYAAAVGVIRSWSDALRRGDVRAAAGYFALPSVMLNGPDATGAVTVLTIRTRAQAELANESLPCGARLVASARRGRYVQAEFVLTDRPGIGGGCGGGAGQTASADFLIVAGRIRQWIRAPDLHGGGQAPVPTIPSPTTPQQPGPAPVV